MTKDQTLAQPVGLYSWSEGPDRFTLNLDFPSGCLTAAQLRQAAKIAAEKGREFADLTTDQGMRLYGIPLENEPEIAEQLRGAGIQPQGPEVSLPSPAQCPLAGSRSSDLWDSGVHEQQEPELFTIGVPILAGRMDADQMRKTADLSERHADGNLRLTPRQNLLFLNVPKEKVVSVLEGLEAVHLSARASTVARALVLCPSGEPAPSQTTRLAKELVEYLETRVPMDQLFTLHLNRSENGCAGPPEAEICLRGGREGFEVWVVGRPAAQEIPVDQLKFRLEQLLVGYKRSRNAGETLRDFCARSGDEAVSRLLAPE